MSQWTRPYVFNRNSNIYTFSRNPLPQKNNYSHIFMPWNDKIIPEKMFKIKSILNEHGECFIPFMGIDHRPGDIKDKNYELIKNQLEHNIETHLVMSNLDSIHVYKIKNIHRSDENFEINILNTIDGLDYNHNYNFWIEVEDVFVYKANHLGNADETQNTLSKLIETEQVQNIFATNSRWVDANRSLTYDYYIRSCELEESIFQETWNDLSQRTQYRLIMSEQLRYQSVISKGTDKLNLLIDSYESYMKAVLNELNAIYIRPFVKTIIKYESLNEAWKNIEVGLVDPKLKVILDDVIAYDRHSIPDLDSFLTYIYSIKSCLFTLKNKFEKKIGKEEFLLISNYLSRQENLIESFLCQNLEKKILNLIKIKNWITDLKDINSTYSDSEFKDCSLKLNHLLTSMTSTSYEDNIFFKIIEEKTSKCALKRSFEEEVKSLSKAMCKAA